jgi:hypothetical protein
MFGRVCEESVLERGSIAAHFAESGSMDNNELYPMFSAIIHHLGNQCAFNRDADDVHGLGTIQDAGVSLEAENLRFFRIDRINSALEFEIDEIFYDAVAYRKFVVGSAHDCDAAGSKQEI